MKEGTFGEEEETTMNVKPMQPLLQGYQRPGNAPFTTGRSMTSKQQSKEPEKADAHLTPKSLLICFKFLFTLQLVKSGNICSLLFKLPTIFKKLFLALLR